MKSYVGFDGYRPSEVGARHAEAVLDIVRKREHKAIVNPCGEIPLLIVGGKCVIGDIVPYFIAKDAAADFKDDVEAIAEAGVLTARALIRTNLMKSFYRSEVLRTNRIGVGMTGIHEWAWNSYSLTWGELVGDGQGAKRFWSDVEGIASEIVKGANAYAYELGLARPDTVLTIKPAGTVSKLFALTEGAHLPSMVYYLRWVQFKQGDPLVERYRSMGYPIRDHLRTYPGQCIVGFPTILELGKIMPHDLIVTAAQATPEEQFEWVRRLENSWLSPGGLPVGGQVSYTLKYDQKKVTQEQFAKVMAANLPTVRAISVMPLETVEDSPYEYLPEEPISFERYEELVAGIRNEGLSEDIGQEHIDCPTGGCPVTFNAEKI
jgi:hypothetical protein